MHKSLTGMSPEDEKNAANLKWGKQKIVDQKVFIDMYTNQLMKSALLEVSRFCFENLEVTGRNKKEKKSFAEYWTDADMEVTKDSDGNPQISSTISDASTDSFILLSNRTDATKKQDVIKDIQKGIAGVDAPAATYTSF